MILIGGTSRQKEEHLTEHLETTTETAPSSEKSPGEKKNDVFLIERQRTVLIVECGSITNVEDGRTSSDVVASFSSCRRRRYIVPQTRTNESNVFGHSTTAFKGSTGNVDSVSIATSMSIKAAPDPTLWSSTDLEKIIPNDDSEVFKSSNELNTQRQKLTSITTTSKATRALALHGKHTSENLSARRQSPEGAVVTTMDEKARSTVVPPRRHHGMASVIRAVARDVSSRHPPTAPQSNETNVDILRSVAKKEVSYAPKQVSYKIYKNSAPHTCQIFTIKRPCIGTLPMV
jgi:hypothetical protein